MDGADFIDGRIKIAAIGQDTVTLRYKEGLWPKEELEYQWITRNIAHNLLPSRFPRPIESDDNSLSVERVSGARYAGWNLPPHHKQQFFADLRVAGIYENAIDATGDNFVIHNGVCMYIDDLIPVDYEIARMIQNQLKEDKAYVEFNNVEAIMGKPRITAAVFDLDKLKQRLDVQEFIQQYEEALRVFMPINGVELYNQVKQDRIQRYNSGSKVPYDPQEERF